MGLSISSFCFSFSSRQNTRCFWSRKKRFWRRGIGGSFLHAWLSMVFLLSWLASSSIKSTRTPRVCATPTQGFRAWQPTTNTIKKSGLGLRSTTCWLRPRLLRCTALSLCFFSRFFGLPSLSFLALPSFFICRSIVLIRFFSLFSSQNTRWV